MVLSEVTYNVAMTRELDAVLLGQTLKGLRVEKGWSLRQLALKAGGGISHAHIAEIENATVLRPSLEKVKLICAALGVTLDQVLVGDVASAEEDDAADQVDESEREQNEEILRKINVSLSRVGPTAPTKSLARLADMVLAFVEGVERDNAEERAAVRRRHAAKQARQGDSEIQTPPG